MIKETDLVNCVTDSIKGHIRNVASLNALIPIVKFLLGVSNVSRTVGDFDFICDIVRCYSACRRYADSIPCNKEKR